MEVLFWRDQVDGGGRCRGFELCVEDGDPNIVGVYPDHRLYPQKVSWVLYLDGDIISDGFSDAEEAKQYAEVLYKMGEIK